ESGEHQGADAEGCAGILHPGRTGARRTLSKRYHRTVEGREADRGGRHALSAAHPPEGCRPAHLPLGGIPIGTAPQILPPHHRRREIPQRARPYLGRAVTSRKEDHPQERTTMKKTLTANISGTVFHVEEDAYEK